VSAFRASVVFLGECTGNVAASAREIQAVVQPVTSSILRRPAWFALKSSAG